MQKITDDLIGYEKIIEDSLRNVIYESFKRIEKTGFPGQHYFTISVVTKFPGLELPASVTNRYPYEVNLVIQHQYKNLIVGKYAVTLDLSFNGQFETITIPYAAISSFCDPYANFCLKFNLTNENIAELEFTPDEAPNLTTQTPKIDLSAKVISLEDFKKNFDK